MFYLTQRMQILSLNLLVQKIMRNFSPACWDLILGLRCASRGKRAFPVRGGLRGLAGSSAGGGGRSAGV